DLADSFARHEFGGEEMRGVLRRLVRLGQDGEDFDFAAAEQTVMALGAITEAMRRAGQLDDRQLAAMKIALDGCSAAISQDEAYRPALFVEALVAFSRSARLD